MYKGSFVNIRNDLSKLKSCQLNHLSKNRMDKFRSPNKRQYHVNLTLQNLGPQKEGNTNKAHKQLWLHAHFAIYIHKVYLPYHAEETECIISPKIEI